MTQPYSPPLTILDATRCTRGAGIHCHAQNGSLRWTDIPVCKTVKRDAGGAINGLVGDLHPGACPLGCLDPAFLGPPLGNTRNE